jgi:hypothetical protein
MNQAGYKQCKICPYLDKAKSMLHNENGRTVNPMNKPFCKLVDDWVDEITKCEGLKKIKTITYELKCNATHEEKIIDNKGKEKIKKVICGKTLAFFDVDINEKGSKIGLMNLRYTPQLLAYRPRKDGLMGFECLCGGSDTRLSKKEFEAHPDKFPAHIRNSEEKEAKFNEPTSTLIALKVNKEK